MTSHEDRIGGAYAHKRVLVTGASGFLGGVTLSLLLSRAREIDRVFVLVRRSPGLTAEARFADRIWSGPAFDPLRDPSGALPPVVTVLQGDLTRADLGLDDAQQAGIERLDLILNCAGLVDFHAPLDQAYRVNIEGTRHVGEFALKWGAGLVHVSTCFVAGSQRSRMDDSGGSERGSSRPIRVPETAEQGFFPRRGEAQFLTFSPEREIADIVAQVARIEQELGDQAALARFTDLARQRALETGGGLPADTALANSARRIQRDETATRGVEAGKERAAFWGWPNVYTYSKSIGEQLLLGLVADRGLACSLVRPAIIESALSYPEPGYNQNATTSAPLIGLALAGYRSTPADPELVLDIVPVDVVANALVAVGAASLAGRADSVYQIGTSSTAPCRMDRVTELIGIYLHEQRLDANGSALSRLWAANLEPTLISRSGFDLRTRVASKAVPLALDTLRQLALLTATPKLRTLLERVASRIEVVADDAARAADLWDLFLPFSCDLDYRFATDHITRLWNELGERSPLADLDWRTYWLDVHIPGLRRHVLADREARPPLSPDKAQGRSQGPGRSMMASRASLVERIEEVARSDGYRAAVTWCLGDRPVTWTYRDLWDRTTPDGSHTVDRDGPLDWDREGHWLQGFLGALRSGRPADLSVLHGVTGRALADRLATLAGRLDLRERHAVVISNEDPRSALAALATWYAKGEIWLVEPALLDAALESSAAEVAVIGSIAPAMRHRLRAVLDVAPHTGQRRLDPLHRGKVEVLRLEGDGFEGGEAPNPESLDAILVRLRDDPGVSSVRILGKTAIVRPDLERFADFRRMFEGMHRLLIEANADRPHAERLTGLWITLSPGDPVPENCVVALSAREDRPPDWASLPDERIPLDDLEDDARRLARGVLLQEDLDVVWACHQDNPRTFAQLLVLERTLIRMLRRMACQGDGRFHAQAFLQDYTSQTARASRLEYRAAYRVGTWIRHWEGWFKDDDAPGDLLPDAIAGPIRAGLGKATHTFFDRAMAVKVRGEAYLPAQGSLIVVANHSSHLDTGAIKYALGPWGDRLRALAAQDYFFGTPSRRFVAQHFTRLIAVDRQTVSTRWIKDAKEALSAGDWVLFFPEGTRTATPDIKPFKASLGTLVRSCQVPVLPVYVEGTHAILPKGTVIPKGRQITVRIGPPISWSVLAGAVGDVGSLAMDRGIAAYLERAVAALERP